MRKASKLSPRKWPMNLMSSPMTASTNRPTPLSSTGKARCCCTLATRSKTRTFTLSSLTSSVYLQSQRWKFHSDVDPQLRAQPARSCLVLELILPLLHSLRADAPHLVLARFHVLPQQVLPSPWRQSRKGWVPDSWQQAVVLVSRRYTYWVETHLIKPLTEDRMRFDDRDNADFLTEEGQLRYDLSIEAEEFKVLGVNTNVMMLWVRTSNSTSRSMEWFITLRYLRQLAKATWLTQPTLW